MSVRASRRALGKSHPAILRARLDALTDDTPPPVLLTPPAPPAPNCSEAAFQALVVGLAERFRWIVIHNADSRRTDAGVPDLLLLRERCIWRELKTAQGRLRPEQVAMGYRLLRAGGDWAIWRPADWPEIITTLTAEIPRQD